MDQWIRLGASIKETITTWHELGVSVPYATLQEGKYACMAPLCEQCMRQMYHKMMDLVKSRRWEDVPQDQAARVQQTIRHGMVHALNQQLVQTLSHREASQETRAHADQPIDQLIRNLDNTHMEDDVGEP
jgi:hypothetical protein